MTINTTLLLPYSNGTQVQLYPHVHFQWLQEGRAYCVTLTASNCEAIDVYIEANLAALRQ